VALGAVGPGFSSRYAPTLGSQLLELEMFLFLRFFELPCPNVDQIFVCLAGHAFKNHLLLYW
jgi:hypothetical protein